MKDKSESQASKHDRLKESAIIALLTAPSIEEAAQTAGVSDTTIYRWLKLPEFQAELKEARRQAVNLAISKLQQSTASAVKVLQDVAENEDAPASARVSAARIILDQVLKTVELEEVISRIEKLEEKVVRNKWAR